MNKRYVLSQAMKTVFQCLLYVSLFLTFFLLMSITNPQVINLSRTAATTMATFAILLFILSLVYGGYQLGEKKARSVFSSLLITIILTDIASYLQLQIMNVNPANNDRLILFGPDVGLFILAMLLQVGFIYLFITLGYYFYFKINPPQQCCVITSSQEQARHIAEKIATFRQKYRLCDVLHYQCQDVQQAILAHDVVFLAGIPDTEEAQLKSFCYKHGKTIYLQAELDDVIISTSRQSVIDDALFLYIHRVEPTLVQRFVKRAMDILLSLLGLVISSPLAIFAAFAIRLSSPGRVLFRQKRATIGGRVFEIYKFRTMYESACDAQGQSASVNDERITRVGRYLRKYRIDELPQLLNVLKGDMSIVGPRPEMMENVDRYTQEVPEFEYRNQMKAGLTGMAQIDGKYNTTPKDKVILDLLYIENFSLMLDLKLIMRTVTIFFRRDSTEGFQTARQVFCPPMRTCACKPTLQDAPGKADIELSAENTPMETILDTAQLAVPLAACLPAQGDSAEGATAPSESAQAGADMAEPGESAAHVSPPGPQETDTTLCDAAGLTKPACTAQAPAPPGEAAATGQDLAVAPSQAPERNAHASGLLSGANAALSINTKGVGTMDKTLLIMAAGMGSRYGGDKQVDGMGPNGEILLEYSVFDALAAGFTKVVFIIKRGFEGIIRKMVGDQLAQRVKVEYVYQEFDTLPAWYTLPEGRVKPFGTVHAVLCARDVIHEPFAVINADDYYGRAPYGIVGKRIQTLAPQREACMVGYYLKNTVSENGHVTRGVCETDENGSLKSVTETYKIAPFADGTIRDTHTDENGVILDPNSLVSMNLFGFTPWIFDAAQQRFDAFLRGIAPGDLKAEYVLPVLIDQLMKEEGLRVDVLATDASWFGVTYQQDKPFVQAQLRQMHAEGLYPGKLF